VVLAAMAQTLAAPAHAQSCSVTITDMSFGAVDTLAGAPTQSEATIGYNCTGEGSERVLICVYLGAGSVPASGSRQMSNGPGTLSYELYSDPGMTVIWGSAGSGNPPPPIIAQLAGGAASGQALIYGRVFGGQQGAEPGSYASNFSGGNIDVRYEVTNSSDCSIPSGTPAASSSFNVQATVEKECFVTTEPVSFGAHGVLNANVDAEGAVNVRCTPATNYRIRLNGGAAAAAPTERQMSKGAATITYGLYRNDTRDQPWGDTEGTAATGSGNGTEQPHVVYGRVPPQTTPAPGLYTDTVIVTVDY
jgi:spore coat protein U-like protein